MIGIDQERGKIYCIICNAILLADAIIFLQYYGIRSDLWYSEEMGLLSSAIEFAAVLFLAIGFAGYRKEKQVPASRKAP